MTILGKTLTFLQNIHIIENQGLVYAYAYSKKPGGKSLRNLGKIHFVFDYNTGKYQEFVHMSCNTPPRGGTRNHF